MFSANFFDCRRRCDLYISYRTGISRSLEAVGALYHGLHLHIWVVVVLRAVLAPGRKLVITGTSLFKR